MAEKYSTLGDTFGKYFAEESTPERKCTDCGSKDDLSILYTTEAGTSTWVCNNCRARREAAQRESERREAQRVADWDAMDEWEE